MSNTSIGRFNWNFSLFYKYRKICIKEKTFFNFQPGRLVTKNFYNHQFQIEKQTRTKTSLTRSFSREEFFHTFVPLHFPSHSSSLISIFSILRSPKRRSRRAFNQTSVIASYRYLRETNYRQVESLGSNLNVSSIGESWNCADFMQLHDYI